MRFSRGAGCSSDCAGADNVHQRCLQVIVQVQMYSSSRGAEVQHGLFRAGAEMRRGEFLQRRWCRGGGAKMVVEQS